MKGGLIHLAFQWFHHQGRLFGRTDVGAVAAAHAVQNVDLHPELVVFEFFADGFLGCKSGRGLGHFFIGQQMRTDGGMRADHGTLVALNTIVHDPLGHHDGHAAFFVLGGGYRENPVRRKGADRQFVALLGPGWAA